jgi:hypothetical protein
MLASLISSVAQYVAADDVGGVLPDNQSMSECITMVAVVLSFQLHTCFRWDYKLPWAPGHVLHVLLLLVPVEVIPPKPEIICLMSSVFCCLPLKVRRFCQARIRAEAPVVLQLVRAPPQRAFTNVRRLELYKFSSTRGWKFPRTSSYVESVQEWGVVQDAVAAAVAAWPQLEELVLTFGLTLKAYEK